MFKITCTVQGKAYMREECDMMWLCFAFTSSLLSAAGPTNVNAGHYRKINQEQIFPLEENRLQMHLLCSPQRVVLRINDIVVSSKIRDL